MTRSIAVMASGGGTTLEAYVRSYLRGDINTRVGLVIVSRRDAGIFDRVKKLNDEFGLDMDSVLINSETHPHRSGEEVIRGTQTEDEQLAIIDSLHEGGYDFVALMGYMKRIGPRVIAEFGWSDDRGSIYEAAMVNTHPGILPDTKGMFGLNIQQHVLEHGLPFAGQSLHLVSGEYDAGPVIAKHRVAVLDGDDAQSLFARVQAAEKKHLPTDIEVFLDARDMSIKSRTDMKEKV